jgi:membrane-associated phospholipid phosphatase
MVHPQTKCLTDQPFKQRPTRSNGLVAERPQLAPAASEPIPKSQKKGLVKLSAILISIGFLALFIDVPFALALKDNPLPKEIGRILRFSEIGGHGTGAAMLIIGALAASKINLHRQRHRSLAFKLIAGTYLGGLIVDLFKLIIPRIRPRAADLSSTSSLLDTFAFWMHDKSNFNPTDLMSFPSGHAAVAAGLAASLSWFFPNGKPVFIGLAILASLQRVASDAHYISDIFIGAALGLIGAWLCAPRTYTEGQHSQGSNDN